METFTIITPEEFNKVITLVTELVMLVLGTSIGTFTRELLFPKSHTFSENVGLSLVAGFLSFGIMIRYPTIDLNYMFLICISLGFFLPVFKGYLKDKKIFKIIFKVLNKTSDMTSTAIKEINDELEKEEDEEQ